MIRTIYIDPGTAHTAWCIAEPDPARERQDLTLPLRCVDHATIETGTKVPRPPERVTSYIRKSDGVEVVQDMERVVTPADRRRVGDALVEITARHGVTRAVVEMMGRVHLHGSPAAQWAQAESARQVGKVEELILDRLHAAGVEIVTVARSKWASRLRIFMPTPVKGAPTMTRRELLPILQMLFGGGWPEWAGEDERDAGAMAGWDALPALVPKRKQRTGSPRKRTPGDPKPRGPRGAIDKAKHRARRLALRAERLPLLEALRAATGCSCGHRKGRHLKTCARHVPRPEAVARAAQAAAKGAERAARAARREADAEARAARRARLAAHDRACDLVRDSG